MAKYYYDDPKHELKEIHAFDVSSAEVQANNFWNIYSKSEEVNQAVLYSEELEVIKEYKK